MITKRLMALIALASSAALAQDPRQPGDGNIPAPDLFDSQIVCSNALPPTVPTPTVIPEGAMESALDTAIGMGNVRITNPVVLRDLGFVIPAQGSNCGRGPGETAFSNEGQGAVATDVATGYTALLPKFMAVYGDPGILTSTGTAGSVARAEADETTSTAVLASLRRTLASAQARDTEARAEFKAIAQGSIYQAATVSDDGVADTSQSNFDQAANLVVPMRLVAGELQSIATPVQVAQARANREAATQKVIDHFQNPGSFYAQLIARRQSLKAFAEQRSGCRAGGRGGLHCAV